MSGRYVGRHRAQRSTRLPRIPLTAPLVVLAAGATGAIGANAALSEPTSPAQPASGAQTRPVSESAIVTAADTTNPIRSVRTTVSRSVARTGVGGGTAETPTASEELAARKASAASAKASAAKKKANDPKRWVRPLDGGYVLTSTFGMRWGKMHPAQDLALPVGAPVRALSSGEVLEAKWNTTGFGNRVVIRYWDGTISWFAHNSSFAVKAGDKVVPGQVVAHSGDTGWSTGPHLHVEIRPDGKTPVPPIEWFKAHGAPL